VRTLTGDIRQAFRVFTRAPGFAIAAIGVLALGIGANTAIFSLVNTVLLRPLPFDDPAAIVRLYHVPPQNTFPGILRFSLSPANFDDWHASAHQFEAMALFNTRTFVLRGDNEGVSVLAGSVDPDFFGVLRAKPALGRVFRPEENTAEHSHLVILSHRFWQTHLAGRPDAVGQDVLLTDEPYTIVGVMPERFSVRAWTVAAQDVWVPLALTPEQRAVRENHNLGGIARLAPGATVAQAQAELDVISKRLEQTYPRENAGWGATVVPLQDAIVGDIRLWLVMLLAAVTLVLAIACANVGNLLLARSLSRRKELAIRAALGAGRWRVFQQCLVESIVLAVAGGIAGSVVAYAILRATTMTLVHQVPRIEELTIDARMLLFVAGVSIVTGVVAGALPALRVGRTDVTDALRVGGRQDSVVSVRTRRALVVCEVALSVVLLMGAAIMLRSLLALNHVDPGFQADHVLTARVTLPRRRYSTPANVHRFIDAAMSGTRALPGSQAVGAIDQLPLQGGSVQPIVLEGQPELSPREQPTVSVRQVTSGYFEAMHIPIVGGRDVRGTDANVVLVSRNAAKLLWGAAEDPIGHRIMFPLMSRTQLKSVVGIVGDVKQGELADPPTPTIYRDTNDYDWNNFAIVLRTSSPPELSTNAVTSVIHNIDPQQPVEVRTMTSVVDDTLASRRFSVLLLGMFASLALVLVAVGIYSGIAYIVRGRRREIGIRTALGAQTQDVLRLFVLEGMKPAFIGVAIGTAAALASATLLSRLVFGISATDPVSLLTVAAILVIVAVVASLVPAWRASRLSPLAVLRDD